MDEISLWFWTGVEIAAGCLGFFLTIVLALAALWAIGYIVIEVAWHIIDRLKGKS